MRYSRPAPETAPGRVRRLAQVTAVLPPRSCAAGNSRGRRDRLNTLLVAPGNGHRPSTDCLIWDAARQHSAAPGSRWRADRSRYANARRTTSRHPAPRSVADPLTGRAVQVGHHLPVGGPGGRQLAGAFGQLARQVGGFLFEVSDPSFEGAGVLGAPRPDSCQACSPRSPESFFSSWRTRAPKRPLRAWAPARSACREARLTRELEAPSAGGWASAAWTC
jgi:hypothetical protein